jgi:L-lactate permease
MIARSALLYTVLRLLAFLVPFALLMLLPAFQELPWLAAVFAALIGLSLSLLFLRRPLTTVTSEIAERRARTRRSGASADADAEDAAADAASGEDPDRG